MQVRRLAAWTAMPLVAALTPSEHEVSHTDEIVGPVREVDDRGAPVADGTAAPLPHAGSAMLRGLARADGFAVIEPGTEGRAGAQVPFVPLPLLAGARI